MTFRKSRIRFSVTVCSINHLQTKFTELRCLLSLRRTNRRTYYNLAGKLQSIRYIGGFTISGKVTVCVYDKYKKF